MEGLCLHNVEWYVIRTGVNVDKAVKEAISAHDEKLCIILSGIKETGSAVADKALVKEIFDSLSEDSVFLIDAFRLGKEPNGGLNIKPRLVKVRVANAAQRSAVLRKQGRRRHLKSGPAKPRSTAGGASA